MIDTTLLVTFSGSNPDIWFKHEPEPFDKNKSYKGKYNDLIKQDMEKR